MALDLSRTSPELMIERINLDNDLLGEDALKLTEVVMDVPFTVAPDADGRNASVLLLSVPEVKYRNDQTVYAKRLDVAEYFTSTFGADPVRLNVKDAVTTQDLLARLNSLYHMQILPNEVQSTSIDYSKWEEDGGGVPHDITFTYSYIFTGVLRVLIGEEYPQDAIQLEDGRPILWEDGSVMTLDTI